MFIRGTLLALLLSLGVQASACCTLRSDGATILVKSILENLGSNLLRGLVVDADGRESRVIFLASDAVEVKRGLWVLKAGDYKSAF